MITAQQALEAVRKREFVEVSESYHHSHTLNHACKLIIDSVNRGHLFISLRKHFNDEKEIVFIEKNLLPLGYIYDNEDDILWMYEQQVLSKDVKQKRK